MTNRKSQDDTILIVASVLGFIVANPEFQVEVNIVGIHTYQSENG